MAKTTTLPWDPAEHLETEEDMAAYLEAALEERDPLLIAAALGDIARAKICRRPFGAL
jgi:probable addiction module antidote protein